MNEPKRDKKDLIKTVYIIPLLTLTVNLFSISILFMKQNLFSLLFFQKIKTINPIVAPVEVVLDTPYCSIP